MSYPSTSYKNSDFYMNLKKKYAEAKFANKLPNSSVNRITEFRQKFEKSLTSRPKIQVPSFEIEPPAIFKRRSSGEKKFSPSQSYIINRPSRETENFLTNSKPKANLEHIIPLSVLVEARAALLAADEKGIQDLPYLYNFSLVKFSRAFEQKIQRKYGLE